MRSPAPPWSLPASPPRRPSNRHYRTGTTYVNFAAVRARTSASISSNSSSTRPYSFRNSGSSMRRFFRSISLVIASTAERSRPSSPCRSYSVPAMLSSGRAFTPAILGERVSGLGVRRLTVATRPRWRRAGTLAGRASRQTAGLHDQPLRRAVVGVVARTPDPAGEVRRAVLGRAVAAGGMQATGAGTTETDTGAAAAVASSCVPAPGPRR